MNTNVWAGIMFMILVISGVYFSSKLYRKIEKRDYKEKPALEKLDRIYSGGVLASGLGLIFIGILFIINNP